MRKQLRQLSGDTAVYGITTVVQRFLSFLLTPFYTHFLFPDELGIQANIFAVVAFLLVLANAGMESAFFKFDSVATSDTERRQVFWNAIGVNWGVAFLLGLAIVVFPGLFNTVASLNLSERYYGLLRIAGVMIALDSMSMITLALLRMRRRAFKFGVIKIAAVAVTAVLNVILVGVFDMKLNGVFIAAIAGSAAQFLLTLPFTAKMFPVVFSGRLREAMLRFGIPTIVAGVAAIGLQRIDALIVQNIAGFEALGLYQANYRLGIVMMMFVAIFEFAWRPFFLQQASDPNAHRLFARIFTYVNLIAAFLLLSVSFFIANIAAIPIPFSDGATFIARGYWKGLFIVPIVMAAYMFNGWYVNFIAGIYIEKRTKALVWITGLGAIIKAALCFVFVPSMPVAGGAWATLAAYISMSGALLLYVRRFFHVPYEWGRVLLIFLGLGIVWGVNVALFDVNDYSLGTTVARVGLLAAFPVWLFFTGFFRSGELAEIRRLAARFGRRT